VRGPFTLACLLTDGLPIGGYFTKKRVNRILEWIDRKPDVVHSLVEKCTKTIMRWIKAQRDVMGWDREFRLADDLVAYITPEQFKEFALPYLRRIYSELDHPLNVYHNCHYSNHLLKLIPETKAHIFHTGPPKNCDFFKAKELIGNQICLMGNISCYELPMKTVNEVERECKEVIQKCAPGGGFILSSSTSILPGTPHENIDVIIDSAEKYGKYPIFESL
jgi:uroporphyrinogen-III decarboxylase